ncbi:MAG: hypothetical protein WDN28_17610 [Chthoniobacter sp.]
MRDATRPDDQCATDRRRISRRGGAAAEKDRFVRDAARPYLISDIRRGADGVVTIYVREIINQ